MSNSATKAEPDPGQRGTAPANGTVEPADDCLKKGDVGEVIACLEKALARAQHAKRTADGAFAEADGLLAAMRALQKESDKAKQAYGAAYKQLKIDQQGYADYAESEEDSLKELIGEDGVAAVENALAAKESDDAKATERVRTREAELRTAEEQSPPAKEVRKAKAKRVEEYKQLAATVGAHHAKLKSLRDDAAKARQAGQYALAYGLVTRDEFGTTLDTSDNELIDPDKLPGKLRDAIAELTKADVDEKAKDKAVTDARAALKQAETDLATQNAVGETRLREALRQIPNTPAPAYASASAPAPAPAPDQPGRDEEDTRA